MNHSIDFFRDEVRNGFYIPTAIKQAWACSLDVLAEIDRICQIFPWGLKGNTSEPKEYYDKAIRLPFEDTTIPVPANYNQLLSMCYGNYLEIHKVWDAHSYPAFDN